MEILRTVVILALFLSVTAFSGCSGSDKNANLAAAASNRPLENTNSARTNIEELALLANVPYETEDVVWKEDDAHKHVVAVLRFSTEDANKVVADAVNRQPPQSVKLGSESWFPAELIAQSEMSGDDSLNGLEYAADLFYQEPYTSGRIVRIESTDYFILELSKK